MGQLFGQQGLTQPNTAIVDPASGRAMTVGSPDQTQKQFYRMGLADEQNQRPVPEGAQNNNPPLPSYKIGQPNFQDAATAGATPGGGNALSPGLTKAGKLATLLTSGLQGALAGRAKSEETVAATGGRRSGGAGMGFEAGYTLPWQRAGQQAQLAQQQAQTGVLQSEAQQYNIPGVGPIPGWLAKAYGPAYLRANATQNAANIRGQYGVQEANIGAQGRVAAQEVAQRFKAIPGVGLFDTQNRQVIPGTQQGVTVTPELAEDYGLPDDFIGKPMKISDLNGLNRNQNQQITTVQGAGGPALVNKRTAQITPLGLGAPAMAGIIPAATDPNNPGNLTYVPKSQAAGLTAPGAASVQAAKTEARSEVPTKIGDQKVAFNTMIQHAQLLRDAARALNNGDVQALAGLKNKFKNAFGYSGPVTAEAIADAYKGEVSNVINKGHITDTGNEKIAHTLDPSKQNYQTIDSVLGAYQSLAQSKLNMLNQQANAAKHPNAPNATPPANRPPLTSFEKH